MISVFDTTISAYNIGNEIIMDAVRENLHNLFPEDFFINLPSFDSIGKMSTDYIKKSDYTFFGGTNALSAQMDVYSQWGIDETNVNDIQNVILFGVGWWQYQSEINEYTRKILKQVLHPNVVHAVRDAYTQRKLESIGINNVINTGCPTTWKLTEEWCSLIPKEKADSVLFTFTDYNQSPIDFDIFSLLKKTYKKLYFWVQGPKDIKYINSFDKNGEVIIIPPSLQHLDNFFCNQDVDYVGTRLHAGIRALQHKKRTIVLSVDNRASEIAKDIKLPVVPREDVSLLKEKICSSFETGLKVDYLSVNKWLKQFH